MWCVGSWHDSLWNADSEGSIRRSEGMIVSIKTYDDLKKEWKMY